MSTIPTLPFEKDHILAAPPELRKLQSEGPIHKVRTAMGDSAWLAVGHQELRALMNDPRLGRSHPQPDMAARVSRSALIGGPQGNFETEPVDAAKMRSRLQPLFSAKRIRMLGPRIDRLVTELLDGLEAQGSPADLHAALALPLPILVICELLGVPYEDRDDFRAWSQAAGVTNDHEQSETGIGQLFEYMQGLVARKRQNPGDDVLSQLCEAEGGTISNEEIAGLGAALLFAGHETTVTRIGYGTVLLATHPDQRDALIADPSKVSTAVEEILRSQSRGGGTLPRYAREDIDIAGVTIRAGELVVLDIGAGNHDSEVFTDPDGFDISRRNNTHLGLGHGMHYCIGAPLARVELRAVFAQLVPRFPELTLAVGFDELSFFDDTLTKGLRQLPVKW